MQQSIVNEDNLTVLRTLPDNSVDLIFCDPPYNMTLEKTLTRYDGTVYDGVHDEWDKYDSLQTYKQECTLWIKECLRVLKPNGSMWVIGSFQNIHIIGDILQSNNAWIINEITWAKTNPTPNFKGTRFTNAHETLLWVVKNKRTKYTFNYKTMKHLNGDKQMTSVWNIALCTGNERLKDEQNHKVHSTQKPLELLKRVILSSSKQGDWVLDPFSGSGTTAVACKMYERNCLAIEQNKYYCVQSLKRLINTKVSTQTDLIQNVYDVKPIKVTFQELIDKKLIDITIPIQVANLQLFFNADGTINYLNEVYTPNQLCKKLFQVPTNAWTTIYYQNEPLDAIRLKYRQTKN